MVELYTFQPISFLVVVSNCGESSNENCTHFESDNPTPGACRAEICPCNDNICQLRLDFLNFQITGPSSSTATTADTINGIVLPAGGGPDVSIASRCLVDSFTVVNTASGSASDIICGTNTGQHCRHTKFPCTFCYWLPFYSYKFCSVMQCMWKQTMAALT